MSYDNSEKHLRKYFEQYGKIKDDVRLSGFILRNRIKYTPELTTKDIDDLFKNTKAAGAYSVTISGAGSSILSLVKNDEKIIKKVSEAMKSSFNKKKIDCEIKVLNIPQKGVIIK